jgi:YjbE family integral membrane protein
VSWNFADTARLIEIVGVNLILSGDNAVVVGLAIRKLPAAQRKTASIAGITGAVVVQTAATLTVASVLRLSVVSCIGGILLTWIAIRLLQDNGGSPGSLDGSGDVFHSIITVISAYLVMCLDNILAVAAVAREHPALLVFGLLLSCVLLIPGSLLIAELMKRYPLLVTAGAALLGWTAGTMIAPALALFRHGLDGKMAQTLAPLLMTIVIVTSPSWWPGRYHSNPVGAKPSLRQ